MVNSQDVQAGITVVAALAAAGVDARAKDSDGCEPLHNAAQISDAEAATARFDTFGRQGQRCQPRPAVEISPCSRQQQTDIPREQRLQCPVKY